MKHERSKSRPLPTSCKLKARSRASRLEGRSDSKSRNGRGRRANSDLKDRNVCPVVGTSNRASGASKARSSSSSLGSLIVNGVAMNIKVEPNGEMTISNDRSSITVHPDGTIALSSADPIQLTGYSLAKLDNSAIPPEMVKYVINALGQRKDKK